MSRVCVYSDLIKLSPRSVRNALEAQQIHLFIISSEIKLKC